MNSASMRAFADELVKISTARMDLKAGDGPTDDAHGASDLYWRGTPNGPGQPPRPSQHETFERPATYLKNAVSE